MAHQLILLNSTSRGGMLDIGNVHCTVPLKIIENFHLLFKHLVPTINDTARIITLPSYSRIIFKYFFQIKITYELLPVFIQTKAAGYIK